MLINVVCPFSRPQFLSHVLQSFKNQTWTNKQLYLMLNNDALYLTQDEILSKAEEIGLNPNLIKVIHCHTPGQSYAKNNAINLLEREEVSVISIFDDDDYYSDDYLSKSYNCLVKNKADIVGKIPNFVMQPDGLFLINQFLINNEVEWVQGATQMFYSTINIRYPIKRVGEDNEFCALARRFNKKVYASDCFDFCYLRNHNNHTHTYGINVVERSIENRCDVFRISNKFEKDIVDGKSSLYRNCYL